MHLNPVVVKTLPQIFSEKGIDADKVAIIKTDTDGYDYDCILSLGVELERISPFLFWENYFSDDKQYDGYMKLYSYLMAVGYDIYYVFDNYGNFMLKTDTDGLCSILRYARRSNKGLSRETFSYIDVLGVKNEKSFIVDNAIKNMLKTWGE